MLPTNLSKGLYKGGKYFNFGYPILREQIYSYFKLAVLQITHAAVLIDKN